MAYRRYPKKKIASPARLKSLSKLKANLEILDAIQNPYDPTGLQRLKDAYLKKIKSLELAAQRKKKKDDAHKKLTSERKILAEQNSKLELTVKQERVKTEREKTQKEHYRAKATSTVEGVRAVASLIRNTLSRDHNCPYCNGPLGLNPHADHIYPVSRGGQSSFENLVFVCPPCNERKSDKSLLEFAISDRLDPYVIAQRLMKLGKFF